MMGIIKALLDLYMGVAWLICGFISFVLFVMLTFWILVPVLLGLFGEEAKLSLRKEIKSFWI